MAEYLSGPTSFSMSTFSSLLFDKIQMHGEFNCNLIINLLEQASLGLILMFFFNHLQMNIFEIHISGIWNWWFG